jgi:transcriptional regulator with XRE-family HTH domain
MANGENLSGNAFGNLIKSFREQRGWSQGQLAEKWGHTREYVSLAERGKRKVDRQDQVNRLAEILGIPYEKLVAVGKMPSKASTPPLQESDVLLQALLEPAQNTVKMSWLIWHGNEAIIDIESGLLTLVHKLDEALGLYRGQFYKPALKIQAYAHEVLGKMAIERVKTKEAIAHFQEMYDIAEELGDADLLALALIHQAEMLRRQHRYDAAVRRMSRAEEYIKKHSKAVSLHTQGMLWKASAINNYVNGDEKGFLWAIDQATAIAERIPITIDTLSTEFDKVEILQVRAIGYTQLWKPEKALEIYEVTDKLRPYRPLRDLASYRIVKAQTYCHVGDVKTGVEHAMAGMEMAESFNSPRYVVRLRQLCERLSATPIYDRTVKDLYGEVTASLERMSKPREGDAH